MTIYTKQGGLVYWVRQCLEHSHIELPKFSHLLCFPRICKLSGSISASELFFFQFVVLRKQHFTCMFTRWLELVWILVSLTCRVSIFPHWNSHWLRQKSPMIQKGFKSWTVRKLPLLRRLIYFYSLILCNFPPNMLKLALMFLFFFSTQTF